MVVKLQALLGSSATEQGLLCKGKKNKAKPYFFQGLGLLNNGTHVFLSGSVFAAGPRGLLRVCPYPAWFCLGYPGAHILKHEKKILDQFQ